MKTKIRYIIVTLIALGLFTGKSYGDDEAIAAIGGFLAGIITGVVIEDRNDHHYNGSVRISTGSRHHGDYRYSSSRCHNHGRYGCPTCSNYGHRKSGHWEIRHVRVWIPGHWEFVRNRCGDHVRIWKSGYYSSKPEKVWVSYSGNSRHGSYRD